MRINKFSPKGDRVTRKTIFCILTTFITFFFTCAFAQDQDSAIKTISCDIGALKSIHFRSGSATLRSGSATIRSGSATIRAGADSIVEFSDALINEVATKIKRSAECNVKVVIHPSGTEDGKELSRQRGNAIITMLTKAGVPSQRIILADGEPSDDGSVDIIGTNEKIISLSPSRSASPSPNASPSRSVKPSRSARPTRTRRN